MRTCANSNNFFALHWKNVASVFQIGVEIEKVTFHRVESIQIFFLNEKQDKWEKPDQQPGRELRRAAEQPVLRDGGGGGPGGRGKGQHAAHQVTGQQVTALWTGAKVAGWVCHWWRTDKKAR